MKTKFKENIISLSKSAINNKVLFERRKNSFLAPLLIFLSIVFMMCVPSYISLINVKGEDLAKRFPSVNEPLKTLLTSSIDCRVSDSKLVCAEDAGEYSVVVGDTIKYTIMANQTAIANDLTVSLNSPKDTDNLIILLKNYIRIRYITRDYIEEQVNTYEIIGDYTKFEGYDFKEIASTLAANPELADTEANNFILNAYMSTMDTRFIVSLSSSLVALILFLILSIIIFKGPYLFKRKKGFKVSECLKLSLTAALPSIIIATLLYLLANIDFSMSFGLIYFVRIFYIYVKYILSTKNSIFLTLYEETNEERFKVR